MGVTRERGPTAGTGGREALQSLIQVKASGRSSGPNMRLVTSGIPMTRAQPAMQQLRRMAVFRKLSRDQLEELAAAGVHRDLRPGEILYHQEDPASSCFVLLSGSMRFTTRLRRRNAISGVAHAYELFGLESLRNRRKRPETAVAVGAAGVLEIDSDFIKPFLVANPDFQLDLLEYVVEKLNEKSAHALRTGHYDAEQRIAAYLINQAADPAARRKTGRRSLSQADVADYLALTPETFCRKVSKFRRLGWVGGSGNEYVIKEREALLQLLDQ